MVKKETGLYLLIGTDHPAKSEAIQEIKKEWLSPRTAEFNLDILRGREVKLHFLQERLLALPLKGKTRVVVIKEAGQLAEEAKEYLVKYAKSPYPHLKIVLDLENAPARDNFLREIIPYGSVKHFAQAPRLDAFTLARQIEQKNTAQALRVLRQLLDNGEEPVRILGGLRHAVERQEHDPQKAKKRFKFLLGCDLDLKTGKLKPSFALERLVVRLCYL